MKKYEREFRGRRTEEGNGDATLTRKQKTVDSKKSQCYYQRGLNERYSFLVEL